MMDFQTPEWICRQMAYLVPSGTKTILEPTPGEGNLVRALSDYEVTAPKDFWEWSGRWDCIVMNPPFSPMIQGYKILYRCMKMSDYIIALMPWLTLINSERRTKDIVDFGLRYVMHLPRTAFPGSRVQTCIMVMNRQFRDTTKLSWLQTPK